MNQTFNAGLKLNKRTIVGDVGNTTGEFGTDRILGFDAFPWIGLELFHAERDTLGFSIEADDLNFDRLADLQGFRWVVDTTP